MQRPRKNNHRPAPQPHTPGAEELTGTVESVVFRSEESGYTVCRVRLDDQREPVVVVGTCAAVWVGESMRATGTWTRHPQHGHQFQAEAITCLAPTSARGIERYLASGLIRGIGKELAQRLVRRFGDYTLRIIEKESPRLQEVDGIGPKRRRQIKDSWIEQKSVRDIMIFLQSHGVGTAQSARIFRQYGDQSIALISENPYRLCADIWGIGFKTADGVAMSMGIPPHSEMRARAGIVHVLRTLTDEGHCFCPEPELILQGQALLNIPAEILAEALKHEVRRGTLIREEDRIFPAGLYGAENDVAAKIIALRRTPSSFRPILVDKAIPWSEKKIDLHLAPRQSEALAMALSEKVSIITGGPGVGKTTIIRALVEIFRARRLVVRLAAPTGRAAKRMEESTRSPAQTIHRMLKFMPGTGHFEHGPEHPLEGDVFILDEVSMMDIELMAAFLRAIPDRSALVLVGDTDQLPSVGPGNVLHDMIASGVIPSTALQTIFRQESGGWIVRNAHRVNEGKGLELPSDRDADFFFIEAAEPDDVIRRLLELIRDRIPKRFGYDPMADIQVLTPMRRNQLGADNLNVVLQEVLNPGGAEVSRFGRKYRQNDRVMQIRNNYDKDVFNGDIGRIEKVHGDEMGIIVNFDGRPVPYDLSELDELVHAYACSIHKSQGSEYPAAIILMTTQHFKLLQRNLLYTAITRGRRLVCLVGTAKAVNMAIRNNEVRLRRTGLRDRLSALAARPAAAIPPSPR